MELDVIYNQDCLEGMKLIPDDSIDLIVTDPPYNIGKAKWDKIPNYIEWCGKWFIECQRVLKDNGSFYWWHNDMVQIAQLMEWLRLTQSLCSIRLSFGTRAIFGRYRGKIQARKAICGAGSTHANTACFTRFKTKQGFRRLCLILIIFQR